MIKIKGTITSLVTPFKKNKKIDYHSLKRIIKYQINNKINNLLILGTTGEFSTLKSKEKIKIIKFTKKIINKRSKLIVGSCYNSTSKSIKYNKKIKKIGVDAIMQSVPSYIKPNQLGIYKHFKKISQKIKIPIIVYDIKKRNGVSLTNKCLKKILKLRNILGIKKSSDNIFDYLNFCKITKKRKKYFYCGDDHMLLFSYIIGGDGCISVVSNYMPHEFNKIYRNLNNFKIIKYNYFKILKIINFCNKEPNPIIIKFIMHKKGLIKNYLREPLISINF
ncbi:4-hydroxy-tetrahydrodipicolinate synthase [Candidatus Vidania fulgoroideorum]